MEKDTKSKGNEGLNGKGRTQDEREGNLQKVWEEKKRAKNTMKVDAKWRRLKGKMRRREKNGR